jgi:hypothetical protein
VEIKCNIDQLIHAAKHAAQEVTATVNCVLSKPQKKKKKKKNMHGKRTVKVAPQGYHRALTRGALTHLQTRSRAAPRRLLRAHALDDALPRAHALDAALPQTLEILRKNMLTPQNDGTNHKRVHAKIHTDIYCE